MRHAQTLGAALTLSVVGAACQAQSLADRIAAASEPRVQFTYTARPEVCGNGRSFIQVAGDQWFGSWTEGDRRDSCAPGPVRVVLDRAGKDVVSIATFAGPAQPAAAGVRDLGRVRAADAAEYFLSLAERADGRVSRDAVLPAMLADSADVGSRLLAIARNQNAARETRRTAISWLGRPLDARERAVSTVADILVQIARNEDDNQSVRQAAMRTLGRLEHGAGTTQLIELARDTRRGWMAREAFGSLNTSGDPRARQYLRDVVRRAELPDEVMAAALRAVGGEYATGEDVKLIRDSYAKLPGDRSRDAALNAIANFGGGDNVRWLLSLARDADQPIQARRRAVRHAYQGGATVADIIKIYDESTDPQLKEEVLSVLVDSGEKQATDKLMQIARTDENLSIRRKAVSVLSRSSDERVKKFLSDLVER
jgi:HEAT repeat protein